VLRVDAHGVASDWRHPRFEDPQVFTEHAMMTNAMDDGGCAIVGVHHIVVMIIDFYGLLLFAVC
jgi:hypothetical protein